MNLPQMSVVVLAAITTLILGRIWYSPLLFRDAWQALRGLSDEEKNTQNRPDPIIISSAVVLWLVTANVFAMFLGPDPDIWFAVGSGASAGLCWVALSLAVNYLFERRPLKLFFINGGFLTIQFTLYGVVFGLL